MEKQPRPFEQRASVGGLPSSSANQIGAPIHPRPPVPRKTLSQPDIEHINKIMNDIEDADKSDVEAPGFEADQERYVFRGKKRAMNTEKTEGQRSKVCSCNSPFSVRVLTMLSGAGMTF